MAHRPIGRVWFGFFGTCGAHRHSRYSASGLIQSRYQPSYVHSVRWPRAAFAGGTCRDEAATLKEWNQPIYRTRAAPEGGLRQPKPRRKDKWSFSQADGTWFCIAGIWHDDPVVGEAYTMLTTEAGPDVRPYHHRQIIVPPREAWARWLDPTAIVDDLLAPSPAGTFAVAAVR